MNENGYYESDDLWKELSDSEKKERLTNAGFELVINCDKIWANSDDNVKRKILSSYHPIPDGFINLNEIPMGILVDNLEREIMFKSDSTSYIIGKLIEYYKNNEIWNAQLNAYGEAFYASTGEFMKKNPDLDLTNKNCEFSCSKSEMEEFKNAKDWEEK